MLRSGHSSPPMPSVVLGPALDGALATRRATSDRTLMRARTSALRFVSWVDSVSMVCGHCSAVRAVAPWKLSAGRPNTLGSPPTSLRQTSRW